MANPLQCACSSGTSWLSTPPACDGYKGLQFPVTTLQETHRSTGNVHLSINSRPVMRYNPGHVSSPARLCLRVSPSRLYGRCHRAPKRYPTAHLQRATSIKARLFLFWPGCERSLQGGRYAQRWPVVPTPFWCSAVLSVRPVPACWKPAGIELPCEYRASLKSSGEKRA